MIAHILPIKRMPRALGYLSYTVPEALVPRLQVGQLVTMPLRKSSIYGLVFSIETIDSDDKLKPIETIVHEAPLLTKQQLDRIEIVASLYGMSHGTVASLFTPPLQKRKLAKADWSDPLDANTYDTTESHATYLKQPSDEKVVLQEIPKQSLILVPQIADIETVVLNLPKESSILTWYSGLSVKEQFERWFAVRAGEYDYIVGTRTALFLPIHTLGRIVIWHEHDSSHKHWEGHPRYDVRDLVPLFAPGLSPRIDLVSYTPRFDTYYQAAKGYVHASAAYIPSLHAPIDRPQILSLSDERKAGNTDILAERTVEAIRATTGHTVLYINRKGYGNAVGCSDCAFVSRCNHCGMPHMYYASTNTLRCHYCRTAERMPVSCPECSGTSIAPFGIGTEQVQAYAKEKLADLGRPIIRIDGDQDELPEISSSPSIIIGTDKLLSIISWEDVSLVIMVQIDDPLNYPDYRAMESVWHTIRTFDYRLTDTAEMYIQSYQPDHLLLKSLREPERLYRTDLQARNAFSLPPYTQLVRLNAGGVTEFAARKEAERVHSTLERTLTDTAISATMTYPIATSPTFYRGKHWYTILVKLDTATWQESLKVLIAHLPSNWRVDVSPQSLLSP
jgi:primosomal protein N' (replication factor Y)